MLLLSMSQKVSWKYRRTLLEAARELRSSLTPAECILWNALRNRRFRYRKFQRQVPIDRFVVDFLCKQSKLILELDGGIHDDQREHDQEREEYLQERGYRILRFRNEELYKDLEVVLKRIEEELF